VSIYFHNASKVHREVLVEALTLTRIMAEYATRGGLGVSSGAPDQPNHPELDAATRKISDLARKHHLSNGVPVTSINGAKLWCAVGGLGA
jgi:hypothetical protein